MSARQDGHSGALIPDTGATRRLPGAAQAASLADVLERVLDKGIVIAGDITIAVAQIELLQIKVRLLIASIDKAQEMGINWWQSDPALHSRTQQLETENRLLRERLERLESQFAPGHTPPPQMPGAPYPPAYPPGNQPPGQADTARS